MRLNVSKSGHRLDCDYGAHGNMPSSRFCTTSCSLMPGGGMRHCFRFLLRLRYPPFTNRPRYSDSGHTTARRTPRARWAVSVKHRVKDLCRSLPDLRGTAPVPPAVTDCPAKSTLPRPAHAGSKTVPWLPGRRSPHHTSRLITILRAGPTRDTGPLIAELSPVHSRTSSVFSQPMHHT